MLKLDRHLYGGVLELYQKHDYYFPLIGAVLLNKQNGVVYANNIEMPTQAYVEHAFGFAQIFGQTIDDTFEKGLERYLISDKSVSPGKVRLYAAYQPMFLTSPQYESMRSYRQRFFISKYAYLQANDEEGEYGNNITIGYVDENNVLIMNDKFGVVTRFWRTAADFVQYSNSIVVFYEGNPASICYSAAEANGYSEIDVFTLSQFRNLGLAKIAVSHFVRRCFDMSIDPLWDCFINNAGSMMLCKSLGFYAPKEPYPFYTINK